MHVVVLFKHSPAPHLNLILLVCDVFFVNPHLAAEPNNAPVQGSLDGLDLLLEKGSVKWSAMKSMGMFG